MYMCECVCVCVCVCMYVCMYVYIILYISGGTGQGQALIATRGPDAPPQGESLTHYIILTNTN